MKRIVSIVKELYKRYYKDEIPALGAQMAYYFLLAVFPFMIFLTTIIGYSPISTGDVMEPLTSVLPREAFDFLSKNIDVITKNRNLKLLSIGFLTTIWAASNGVSAVMHGINKAYNEQEVRPFWKIKIMSIIYTIVLSLMIIFYFLLLIFGNQIGSFLSQAGIDLANKNWNAFRYIIIIFLMITVFSSFYYFTPCKRLKLRHALPGAIFTTIGWILTSVVFSFYVDNFWNLTLVYGSIGGIIALLVWLYLSAILIIMGGEVNAILYFENRELKICKEAANPKKSKEP